METPFLGRSTVQFYHFFPTWNKLLSDFVKDECRNEMDTYMTASAFTNDINEDVFSCIARHFPDNKKAELTASAVVLGLAPTVLQMLSPTAAETAVLALRRPVLALLIAASTVTLNPLRPREYAEHVEALERAAQSAGSRFAAGRKPRGRWMPVVVSVAEYLVVCAALGNAAYRTYQLCVWTVCTFVPDYAFLPGLWHCAALVIHLFGWLGIVLRVKPLQMGYGSLVARWVRSETTPSAWALKLMPERRGGRGMIFCNAVVEFIPYMAVPLQILYGTLVLSSLAFVSVLDSLIVVLWYCLSTVVCRAVLMYELAAMKHIDTD